MRTIPINDLRLRLIGIPALALIVALCFNLFYTVEFGIPFWKVLLSNLVYVTCVVELTRLLVLYANYRFPAVQHVAKRISFLLVALVLLAPVLGTGHIYLEKDVLFQSDEEENLYSYLSAGGSTLFFTLIVAAVYEAWHFFVAWNQTEREKVAFEKASIEAQYELLKSQVQPHFLFNSLNTVVSLVDEDAWRAKKFIKELSLVYRYLLQSNMHTLVSLHEELAFIKAYRFLLQTRFESGLELNIEVAESMQHHLLPPLTLQILVENAVKHNRADAAEPLIIQIKTEGSSILVQNNLQPKTEPINSTRLGLSNIAAKYAALQMRNQVRVSAHANSFSVSLPLIDPAQGISETLGVLQKGKS